MATIAKLCDDKVLVQLTVRLSRREHEERRIFAYPGLVDWLKNVLPSLQQIVPTDVTPRQQFFLLLQNYIAGKPMTASRMFRRMRPLDNDVYELKTPDLRIFGWFHEKNEFIALAANEIATIKRHGLYVGYIGQVVRARQLIDLDEPKCLWGAEEHDVISV